MGFLKYFLDIFTLTYLGKWNPIWHRIGILSELWCPKNHGISKLVPKQTLLYRFVHPFIGESLVILRVMRCFFLHFHQLALYIVQVRSATPSNSQFQVLDPEILNVMSKVEAHAGVSDWNQSCPQWNHQQTPWNTPLFEMNLGASWAVEKKCFVEALLCLEVHHFFF